MNSRLQREADAVRQCDNTVSLSSFPCFAELKRSLREWPLHRSSISELRGRSRRGLVRGPVAG